MRCSKCGSTATENNGDHLFCANCGSVLGNVALQGELEFSAGSKLIGTNIDRRNGGGGIIMMRGKYTNW